MLTSSTPVAAPIAVDTAWCAACFEAVRWHETRDLAAEIYAISFAEDGQSGGSFGAMQNDCHASGRALSVFTGILLAAKMPIDQRGRVIGLVAAAQRSDPLSPADRAAVNAALESVQGRAAVDQLDQSVFRLLLPQLDRCIAAAAANGGAAIATDAAMGMAIWINASGAPSTLLRWLGGEPVIEHAGRPALVARGQVIDQAAFTAYLALTLEFSRSPRYIEAMTEAMAIGLAKLPPVIAA